MRCQVSQVQVLPAVPSICPTDGPRCSKPKDLVRFQADVPMGRKCCRRHGWFATSMAGFDSLALHQAVLAKRLRPLILSQEIAGSNPAYRTIIRGRAAGRSCRGNPASRPRTLSSAGQSSGLLSRLSWVRIPESSPAAHGQVDKSLPFQGRGPGSVPGALTRMI